MEGNKIKIVIINKDNSENSFLFGENAFFKVVGDLKGTSSIPGEQIRVEFKDRTASYEEKIRYYNFQLSLKDDEIKDIKVFSEADDNEILLFNSQDLNLTLFGHFFDELVDINDPLNEGVKFCFCFV